VVEVGPGLGTLTQALARRAGRVIAIELDEALAHALARAFEGSPRVTIVQGDAREVSLKGLVGERPYKVVANLPYYAALPILRRFLEEEPRPSLLVVMVQWEVAQAMVATPGRMSLLSVAVQFYGVPRIVARVPPGAFHPRPKVSSAIVRIDVLPRPAVEVPHREAFFRVVRGGFAAPRKQLRNSLAQGLGLPSQEAARLLAAARVDPQKRPQDLSLEEWARLAQAYARHHEPAPLP